MKIRKAKIFILFLLLISSAFTYQGKVIRLKGTAKATHNGRTFNIKVGQKLDVGDKIMTGNASIIHVILPNEQIILVKEKSSFTFEGKQKKILISFAMGEFLIGLKNKLKKNNRFSVRTPTSVLAVRGTLFWGLVKPDGSSEFICLHSLISISRDGKSVYLNPGDKATMLSKTKGITLSKANVPVEYLDTFNVQNSLAGIKKILAE